MFFASLATGNAQTLTWDSNTSGTGTDGAGTWDLTTTNWISSGTTHTTWSNTIPNSAIIGSGGNGGIITLGTNISVGNLTFATVSASHPYTITGNTLTLGATSTITTNSNATIASVLAGASTSLTKAGTDTLTVTASSTYTGATIVNAGTLVISGGINTINLNSSSSMTINNGGTVSIIGDNSLWGYGSQVASKVTTINTGGTLTINVAQNTAHLGPLVLAGGTITSTGTPGNSGQTYGSYNFDYGVTAGGTAATSTISATSAVPSQVGGTVFNVSSGATNGIDLNVTSSLANTTGMPDTGIIKTGDGVMQLSGQDTYLGSTTIQEGTLALNYTTNNNNKLSNSAALNLAGGTLTITGGSITETVGSTTLTAGNQITRVSGSTVLQLGAITRNAGATLNISASSITTTTTLNTNGILGTWATINGTAYATNSTNVTGVNGPITALGTYNQTLTRLSSGTKVIANTAANNVQITDGTGTAANITLAAATTTINTLTNSATGGVSTINPNSQTFRVGGILAATGSGGLTIGNGTNNGTLTASTAGGELNIQNFSSHDLTVNSVIANNSTASSLTIAGGGNVALTGTNTYTGTTTINQGTLTLSGTGSLAGTSQVSINNGGTLLLNSTATNQVNSAAGVTLNGGTLQLGTGNTTTQLGALTLSSSSVIDFSTLGGTNNLDFANSSASTWASGAVLSVYNWTPGVDHLYFGSVFGAGLPAGALSQIVFYTDDGTTLATAPTSYGPGNGEVSPIPEPSAMLAGMALLGLIGYRERRWVLRCRAARKLA